MKTYYIYHIPGVKIGCTSNLERRVKQQTKGDWELLETHTDIDIASQREQELQKQYGYKVDTLSYKQGMKIAGNQQSHAGRVSATKQWNENRERELEKCKKGGLSIAEKTRKSVHMYDFNGNYVMSFSSRKEAAKYVNGFSAPLTYAINKPDKSYKGYRWKD